MKMGKLIAILSLAILLIPGVANANLLVNADFETGSLYPWGQLGYHTAAVNTAAKYSGTYGAQVDIVTGSGTGDGWGGRYENKSATPGNIYSFSAMVNTLNLSHANASLQISFFDVTNPSPSVEPIAVYDTTPITGQGWTQLSLTSNPAPGGTQAVRFVLASYGDQNPTEPTWSGSGYVYFDDADANLIPEPASLLLLGTGLVGLVGLARRKKV